MYIKIFCLFYFINVIYAGDLIPAELRVEYLHKPLSIDSGYPRLYWIDRAVDQTKKNLSQTAYQIVVASSEKNLKENIGDLWDTNKVKSDETVHIEYNGKELTSRQKCYWKVKVWDQKDSESEWSADHKWEMGLLKQSDWTAKWIGAPKGMQENAMKDISDIDKQVYIITINKI